LSVQSRFPKDTKWLYPQNQAFADDKFAGKNAEPFHWKEVLHNFKKLEMFFLTPQWVGLFGTLGVIALLFVIASVVWLIFLINDPSQIGEMFDTRSERKMMISMPIIAVASFFVAGGMAMGFLSWAISSAKYLKYPTPAERQYRQMLDKGKIITGLVERIEKVDEKFVRIKFSTKNRTDKGEYETISPVGKALREGDRVIVFKSDYAILL
jgi:hypothetical protein